MMRFASRIPTLIPAGGRMLDPRRRCGGPPGNGTTGVGAVRDRLARRGRIVATAGDTGTCGRCSERRHARRAAYQSTNPAVGHVEHGRVVPTGNGKARIEVVAGDRTASVSVEVRDFDVERRLNFTNDIEPVLTKFGCNAGGCHGKASGQNGFKLSLLGFDPAGDYNALVKEGRGRRIFPAAAGAFAFADEADGQYPHGGGRKFDHESPAYSLLRGSIKDAPRQERRPDRGPDRGRAADTEWNADTRQQIRVVAHLSDGTRRRTSRPRTEIKSQQPDMLNVDASGQIATLDATGEGDVMVRYMGQVDIARDAFRSAKRPPMRLCPVPSDGICR